MGVSIACRGPGQLVMEQPFIPIGSQYLVELNEPATRSEGGVWLPDNWVTNWTDATVIATGPGRGVGPGIRTVMWARPGDIVLFQRHDYRSVGEGYRHGTVNDEDLIAYQMPPDVTLRPLNDWVMIRQDPDIRSEGAIVLAEEYRPRPMHGEVVDWGPGRLRLTGNRDYYGTRRPVAEILNVPNRRLRGLTVYWPADCEVLAVGRSHLEYVLIKADDLMGCEDPDEC